MKKVALALCAIALAGAGCSSTLGSEEQSLKSNILNAETDDLRGAHSYQETVSEGTLYTSSVYSFSMVLPFSWGEIYEDVKEGPTDAFEAVVRVSSLEDSSSYVDVYVVKSASAKDVSVTDLPATKVGEISNRYVYYISGAGDSYGRPGADTPDVKEHLDETNAIRDSFETAI